MHVESRTVMAPSRALQPLTSICTPCARKQARAFATSHRLYYEDIRTESRLPRVASRTLWASLIPKPFRTPQDPVEAAERAKARAARKKMPGFWSSPYSIFVLLAILVGSNAIQIIGLRREMLNFSRKTEAKLELLREVVRKVRRGEEVDVRKALGTGDSEAEAEWEDTMKEIEITDQGWEGKEKRDKKRAQTAEQQKRPSEEIEKQRPSNDVDDGVEDVLNERRPKFMM